jgi:putative hydrolase of the HAD superfamily
MNNATQVKAIIFDLGGVLDTVHYIRFYKKGFHIFNRRYLKVIKNIEMRYRIRDLDRGKISLEEYYAFISKKLKVCLPFDTYISTFRSCVEEDRVIYDFIEENLKGNYKLYILSNNSPLFITSEKREKLAKIFDKQFYSFELGIHKPNEEIYKKVLDDIGFKPEECLFVDNSMKNTVFAEKLGIQTYVYSDFELFEDFLKENKLIE